MSYNLNSEEKSCKNEFKKLTWSTKAVLSGKSENFQSEKFADFEFSYKNEDEKKLQHKTITFTKEDVGYIMKEFGKIKENLNKISSIK